MKEATEWADDKEQGLEERDSLSQEELQSPSSNGVLEASAAETASDTEKNAQPRNGDQRPKVPPPPNGGYVSYTYITVFSMTMLTTQQLRMGMHNLQRPHQRPHMGSQFLLWSLPGSLSSQQHFSRRDST